MAIETLELRHERVSTGEVTLHVVRAGEGAPVILLHGFPEHWYSWRHQIPALANAGFSVMAPDLRGYNLSDRPSSASAYHLRHLVDDVAALVRASGHPRAHVVGHDWGGIVAWAFAGRHPELLDRLVIMNAPHMAIYLEKVRRPSQMLRSWYVLFFQLPALPELALRARDYRAVRDMFEKGPVQAGAFSPQDVQTYVDALSLPGALKAGIDYYRANLGTGGFLLARSARVEAPTLVIWGEKDPALDLSLLDGLERFAPRVRVHRIPDASHWIQSEAPEEVNRALVGFLREGSLEGGEGRG